MRQETNSKIDHLRLFLWDNGISFIFALSLQTIYRLIFTYLRIIFFSSLFYWFLFGLLFDRLCFLSFPFCFLPYFVFCHGLDKKKYLHRYSLAIVGARGGCSFVSNYTKTNLCFLSIFVVWRRFQTFYLFFFLILTITTHILEGLHRLTHWLSLRESPPYKRLILTLSVFLVSSTSTVTTAPAVITPSSSSSITTSRKHRLAVSGWHSKVSIKHGKIWMVFLGFTWRHNFTGGSTPNRCTVIERK